MVIKLKIFWTSLVWLVREPTHVTNVGSGISRTLIDLDGTKQPHFVHKNHVAPPPDSTCHHYINYIELNLRIPFQKSITKKVWHYNRANTRAIYDSCNNFDWRSAFNNKSLDEAVEIFDSTILNIARNFIPNEMKTVKA